MTDSTTPPSESPPAPGRRNFYGRIKGKTLRASQKSYLEEDLGPLTLQGVTRDENPTRTPVPLEPWRGQKPLWLEVGFGGGEHLIHQAAQNPGIAILGAEPFVNGIAMLLGKVRAERVENLRLHPGDVRDLFEVLPEASLEKVFLNYPDPWPKARHHRRRFVTQEYLQPLARLCAPGAEFRIASDIPDYIRQAREEVPLAGFTLTDDSPTPWQDWLSTRYEQKALREGRTPHYLTYRR
ncbi:tRNA (guanine(46)-N(7))-methyltransferase TrmB [Rhodobacter sp. KR11]|uniref:tRNA (guanine(46)-N(7))-methyltransferase TrmB n=1 Tax=Rhodobacter sp. KR11 TaxID=2974588 RepID=UPI0022222B6E|nr:tRNA (guanine(46)-N(7))-methyltransferase TrmB [Rhodobacter sp. KR11]MCW1918425.1 tRNA (guanine(46)-N(7))-methyltransferase TrmB [Rhodobacter sp. KR11]